MAQPADMSIDAARAVLHAHIEALNARDERRLSATLHFPHYRLSGTDLKIWETPDSYFADFRARAGANWARSEFSDIREVQAATDKVHFDVTVNRFDADDQLISTFRSLWIITRENAQWAAKFRSSFAAQ